MSILKSYFLVEFELKLYFWCFVQRSPKQKMGIFKPKAYFWVGGQNKEIMVFSELLDNAI